MVTDDAQEELIPVRMNSNASVRAATFVCFLFLIFGIEDVVKKEEFISFIFTSVGMKEIIVVYSMCNVRHKKEHPTV